MSLHVLLVSSTFLLLSIISHVQVDASVSGYITSSETERLVNTLKKSLVISEVAASGGEISQIYYGAAGLKLLQAQIEPNTVKENCAYLKKNFKQDDGSNPEVLYQGLSVWSSLACPGGNLHTQETIKILKTVAENEKSGLAEVRYSVEGLKLIGQSLSDPNKITRNVQAKLKEDDSLQNLGQAMHIAAHLGGAAGKFALDRVEDLVVQADEVDGKMLQWEGGLSTTSLIITGLLKLSSSNKPFNQLQTDKLATYLLTRKTVQTPRGILALIEAINALSLSPVPPVSISIVGAPYITTDKPELKIRVSDLLGRALKTAPAPVVAQSATRVNDDVVVLSKQPLTVTAVQSEFLLPLRLEPGQYKIVLAAGTNTVALIIRILGPVSLTTLEIGLVDNDGSSGVRLNKLQYPQGKLSSALLADASQRLLVKFPLSRTIHQAFLRLHAENKEIIFVAEPDNNKLYKVDVNLASELSNSGTFLIELILGDSVMSNPIRWSLGSIEVNLGTSSTSNNLKVPKSLRQPKPEIKHLFRQAEKRPSDLISLAFTGFTLSPLLLLFGLWLKVGINLGNISLTSLLFQGGFGAILVLYALFWMKLDMFTTCAWLILIGGFTFLAGQRALSQIASCKKLKADK